MVFKINRNVESRDSVDYSMTSKEIVFLQKQQPEVFCKKVFLEILQNSQESTCAKVTFLIKL